METIIRDIPGGNELIDWFGYAPHFHDAYLLSLNLVSSGPSNFKIHTFRMTNEVDDKGYFVLDKHVVVTVTLDVVTHINLSEFNLTGIILELNVSKVEDDLQFDWIGSYGVAGIIRAKQARFDLSPGKPV